MTPKLDLAFVREQFPAFREPSLQGQHFFENAGGSYACGATIRRLESYYRKNKVQPYYAFVASHDAGEQMDGSRIRLAAYLGVDADEVYFGPSTTQNTYVLAQAIADSLEPGDEVVVTNQDHEANSGAWRRLAARGVEVREWRVDPESGSLDGSGLARLLSPRTRIVAFPHCSNVVGEINPVADWATMVHDAGAICVVDGVSYAPHGFVDVDALGADIYMFSMYKTFGPHQGLMVVRDRVAGRFANQGHYFNASYPEKRLVPAGPDHAQVAAAQGVADYFDAVYEHHYGGDDGAPAKGAAVHALFREAERARLAPLLALLREHPRIRIVGRDHDDGQRAPTVAIVVDGIAPADVTSLLAERGIMSGDGNFYAPRLLEAMGIDSQSGVNRLSFVHYTSDEDIARLIESLDEIL